MHSFASNMACLHKETFKYIKILNFSDYVIKDFKKVSLQYKNMQCRLLLPTEKINLENGNHDLNKQLRDNLFKTDRNSYLKKYQNSMDDILLKQYSIEDKTKVSFKLLDNYFSRIISSTPFFIKKYLGKNIFIRVFSKNNTKIFNIDFLQNNIGEINYLPSKKKCYCQCQCM